MPEMFTQKFWDARYSSRTELWSGKPNPRLLEYTSDLAAGTALDVGCGEGADAIWLAERGWRVTALDISSVALRRGADRGAEVSADVAQRIDWVHADLLSWKGPERGSFDLVSAHFMHLPQESREALFHHLAASVAPGGRLLIVGHDPSDLHTTVPRPPMPDLFYTAAEIADHLDPGRWEILVAESRPRMTTDPEGQSVQIHDAVLDARRRGELD